MGLREGSQRVVSPKKEFFCREGRVVHLKNNGAPAAGGNKSKQKPQIVGYTGAKELVPLEGTRKNGGLSHSRGAEVERSGGA